MRRRLMASAFVLLGLAPANAAPAEPVVELGEAEEMEMALSAAPAHLREGAGVYRLGAQGYQLVRPSRNGFHCLVEREPSLGLAPVCHDREGSDTLIPATLLEARLLRAGRSREQIRVAVDAEYAAGRLVAPRRPGIAYMLSTHFTQASDAGGRECIFPPHLMFYAPYLRNADIGAEPGHRGSVDRPWILNEGRPNAYVLVVARDADPEQCH